MGVVLAAAAASLVRLPLGLQGVWVVLAAAGAVPLRLSPPEVAAVLAAAADQGPVLEAPVAQQSSTSTTEEPP